MIQTENKISIVGHGTVGKGMEKLFKRFNPVVYDVATQPDKTLVQGADLAIVCVPTPSKEDGSCDTSAVEEVISWLDAKLILIKSTIPPLTTEYLVEKYHKSICFSPEYMGESSYFTPPWKYPDPKDASSHTFVIIGGAEKPASAIMDYFTQVMSVDSHFVLCSAREAELAKYMENCFFATKVTFCNEFYDIGQSFGVEYKKLRELWLLDPRVNPMHTVVFPNKRGFGGKCYPKDTSAIIKAAETQGYDPTLLKSVVATNKKIRS